MGVYGHGCVKLERGLREHFADTVVCLLRNNNGARFIKGCTNCSFAGRSYCQATPSPYGPYPFRSRVSSSGVAIPVPRTSRSLPVASEVVQSQKSDDPLGIDHQIVSNRCQLPSRIQSRTQSRIQTLRGKCSWYCTRIQTTKASLCLTVQPHVPENF